MMIEFKIVLIWIFIGFSIPTFTPALVEGKEANSQPRILHPQILSLQLLDKNLLGIHMQFVDEDEVIHPIGVYQFIEVQINEHPISWWKIKSKTYENRIDIGVTQGVLALLEANRQTLTEKLIRGKRTDDSQASLRGVRRFMFFNGEIHIKQKHQFSSNLHHFPPKPQFNVARILGNNQGVTALKAIVHDYFANMNAHFEETLLIVPLPEEIAFQDELSITLKGHSPLAIEASSFVLHQTMALSQVDQQYLSQVQGLSSSQFYRDLLDMKKSYSLQKYALASQKGSIRLKNDPESLLSESIPGSAEWIFLTADSLSRIGQIKKARQLFAKVVEGYPDTSFALDSRIWLSKHNFNTLIHLGE